MAEPAEGPAPEAPMSAAAAPRPPRVVNPWTRRRLRVVLLALGPIVVLAAAAYFYVTGGRYVSTDDAYVKADKIAISTEISGRVANVAVHANQYVAADQVLLQLDEEPFRIALERAEAQLAAARNEVEAMRATLLEKQASLKSAEDAVQFHSREFARQQQLAARSVTSVAKLDEARYNLETARQRVAMAHHDIAALLAGLGGDATIATEDHPRVRQARAERDQAALDLRRTAVVAPSSGVITNIDLQAGEYVTASEPLFSLVSDKSLWIEANVKETDLTWLRPGQPATVEVDAYPQHSFEAKVESINPGTGAEFAVLPPQNATGNWVKVVQRVPVRLTLDRTDPELPLRIGMSVQVEIDTGRRRNISILPSAIAGYGGR